MGDLSGRVLDDVARVVTSLCGAGNSLSSVKAAPAIEALETMLEVLDDADMRHQSAIINHINSELESLDNAQMSMDVDGILDRVRDAEKDRIARVEHEMMAKLVNQLPSKESLNDCMRNSEHDMTALLDAQNSIDECVRIRKQACAMLSQLISNMQSSLCVDPPEEDLPPLESVHEIFR
jgi:transcriptional regulator of aromatic amino acid metabolism